MPNGVGKDIAEIRLLVSEQEIKEAFEWVPNIERIKQYNKEGHKGKLYAVKALHEGVTDPKNVGHGSRRYTAEELKRAARTLIGQPLNWNHVKPLESGRNVVIDAEWSDKENAIEAVVYIEDSAAQEAIADKNVTHVSVQAPPPRVSKTVNGVDVLEGIVFDGLALVTKDERPGDPKSTIRLIEVNRSLNQSASNQGRMKIDPKVLAVYENLDAFLAALDGIQDMPDQIKQQLASLAKQLYGAMGELKKVSETVNAKLAELAKVQEDIKNLGTGQQDILKQIKEFKEKPATQSSVKETLTEDERSTVLKEAIRNTPLGEVVALVEGQ